MEKIEKPRVFISYAWGTEEYKDRVLSFANDLMNCGIDVELDRWSLREGFDSYAFMEQSVNDPTITNVIMLLDPIYAKKANARTGGVGTETQIISPEIYNNTKQEKFIPVVFERDEDGSVAKPSFLNGLLHFDLTNEETYDREFVRLVKRLYGHEVIKKPDLGSRPAWVDQDPIVPTKTRFSFEELKKNLPEQVKRERFLKFLSSVKSQIVEYEDPHDVNDVLYHYDKLQEIRDQYLLLIKYYAFISNSVLALTDFFESVKEEVKEYNDTLSNLKDLLLNELFIYTIAFFFKAKDYDAIAKFFCKTYFVGTYGKDEGEPFTVFRINNRSFHKAVCDRDGKRYLSGIAKWWIDHINTDTCSKRDFVFADLLCFNASTLSDCIGQDYWFPICYIYDDEQHKALRAFANKLRSREHLNESLILFGFDNKESFISRFRKNQSPEIQNRIRRYSFPDCFDIAPYIGYYIKADELGTKT